METTVQCAASRFAHLARHYCGDQINEDDMGGEFSIYGGEEWWILGFGG